MEVKLNIFISCAQEDEELRNQLQMQLRILERLNLISIWHKGKINPGEEPEKERNTRLDKAHIILLLTSQHFVDADDCYGIEMMRAMGLHDSGKAHVIPILLRPFDWESTEFARLQVLPMNKKPVTSWSDRNEALSHIAEGIRKVVEELQKSQQAYSIVEEIVDSNRLYNTLVRLDYREQVRVFQQFKNEKRQVGAFLIHGAPSYGQGWLLNRLIKQLPNSSAALDFKFSFERKACGRSLKDLWSELAKWVGLKNLPYSMAPYSQQEVINWRQEIVKRVHGLWQRNTVILILSKLHEMGDDQYINKFLEEFWLPLTAMAQKTLSQSPKHYLLMFLVDTADCVNTWNVSVAKQLDQSWEPCVPIKLEKLSRFSRDVLDSWIGYEVDTLPANLTAHDILDNSEDGIPEFVLDHVCGLFGYDWPELVKYRV